MSALSNHALRRGWCPSTLRPMETGDGWLVRLHPPGGVLTPPQLVRIAELARAHGNGLIEISARGNMQLRGITVQSHPELVDALLGEKLVDEHDGDGPQRLTLVSPLAGWAGSDTLSPHPEEPRSGVSKDDQARAGASFETRALLAPQDEGCGSDVADAIGAAALAETIENAARAIPGLPAKTLVVVDGGGALTLDNIACDLRVVAIAADTVAIGLPGGDWRGPVAASDAPAIVAAILRRFATRHTTSPDTIRRLRDLEPAAKAALCDLPETTAPPVRPTPARAGVFALGAGRFAAMAALPLGRCDAATLAALGRAAEALGARALRLSPWRGLACLGLKQTSAQNWLEEAETLGLITQAGDPRLSVQACAGKPACLRAETDAMADAALLADALAPALATGVTLHVSGCVKSCAHPGASDLTLVGRNGRYGVVLHGTTRDRALAELDLSGVLRRLQPGQDLFARLMAGRVSGPNV